MNLDDLKVGMRIEIRHPYMNAWKAEPLTVHTIQPIPANKAWNGRLRFSAKRKDGTIREVYCWYEHVRPADGE
jgi:hypothetical protein